MGRKAVIGLCMVAVASLLLGPADEAVAGQIVAGDYLRVGVDTSGGLIDDAFTVGIDYDITGTSTWTTWDFLKPGSPFEFYSIGIGGVWDNAGYTLGNPFGGVTTDTSSGAMNSTRTTGSALSGTPPGLDFVQDLSYHDGDEIIAFMVTLTNTTNDPMYDVVYARGLDPDQDVYAGGGYETDNEIPGGAWSDLVYASAPVTDWTIGIWSDSSYPHQPSVDAGWDTNPYALLAYHHDGDFDYTINMAWDIGTLAPGASAAIEFEYRIGETRYEVEDPDGLVPEPATIGLLGCGVVGIALRLRRRRK